MLLKIFIVAFLVFPTFALSSVIVLKSGTTVEGEIIEQTDKYVKVKVSDIPVTYYSDEIEKIETEPSPAPQAVEVVEEKEIAVNPVNTDVPEDPAPAPKSSPKLYEFAQLNEAQSLALELNKPLIFYFSNTPPPQLDKDGIYVYLDSNQTVFLNKEDYASPERKQAMDKALAKQGKFSPPAIVNQAVEGMQAAYPPLLIFVNAQLTEIINMNETIQRVEIPVGSSYVLGNKEAPVTVVMFSDFQCPYCAGAYPQVKQMIQNSPDKLQLVIKHLPLINYHDRSFAAAKAALAAGKQGKFFEMAELLYSNQAQLTDDKFKELAGKLSLNTDEFMTDYADQNKELENLLLQDMKLAQQLHVTATPMFFVNGQNVPYELLGDTISKK